ncbi:hypothetical protein D3218_08480 [Aureimonas flava]|uniref:Uncharacterized protein n=2 Tax=Aureimonas flava TaxID=2320271 RepID=A0A3A1WLT7_9HYPH|nr:hypothetical protein D3218_08480 [Aureimonas flava]
MRRLLVQALVSSTVMVGIQGVLHFAPGLLPFGSETAERRQAAAPASEPIQVASAAPVEATESPSRFVEDRTGAEVKAGRFDIWRLREAAAAPAAPASTAAPGVAEAGPGDVMLFDRCRPDCESRDPLLAFNRQGSVRAAMLPQAAAEPVADSDPAPPAADTAPAAMPDESRNVVVSAARNGMSWARRMAETAEGALSW